MAFPKLTFICLFFTCVARGHATCPAGWSELGPSCLRIYLNASTFTDAQVACRATGGVLASVATTQDDYVVYSLILESATENTFWISKDPQIRQNVSSSDDCTYIKLWGSFKSSCGELRSYICEQSDLTWNKQVSCPSSSVEYLSTCFRTATVSVYNNESREICRSYGGHLADMKESYKSAYAKMTAARMNITLWIGNTDQEFEECMRVSSTGPTSAQFEWATTDCNGKAYSLCEIPPRAAVTSISTASSTNLLTTSDYTNTCPEGGSFRRMPFTNKCYWETTYETSRKSWDEARAFCQRFGGDLASYSSYEEEVFALGPAFAHERGLWIGLRRHPPGDELKWSDGTEFEYAHWAIDQPNLSSPTKYCVAHSGSHSKWELSYCGTHRYFICEAETGNPREPPQSEKKQDLTCEFPGIGQPRKWLKFNDHCYLIESVGSYSWESAKLFCADNNAHVASIHSYEETDFLLGAVHGPLDFWIGLHSEGLHSTFEWLDGTPLDFVFWDEYTEVDVHDMHHCVMFNKFSGYWTVEHCNRLLSVVCKRKNDNSTEEEKPARSSPAVILPGYCPDNWYMFGNNCYNVFGHELGDKETWFKAFTKCSEMGAVLASVHNQGEQDFLTELILDVGYSVWIGLYAVVRGSVFQWMDNSTLDFTNWNEAEPYHNSMEEDCVEMVYDETNMGKWNDIICKRPKAYICQKPKDISLDKPGLNPRICKKPAGWRRLGSSCFKIFGTSKEKKTWLDGQSTCKKRGAHLGTVKNYATVLFIRKLVADTYNASNTMIRPAFWIGAREKEENTYTWLSGLPLSYSNWLRGQPQAVFNHGNCVAVDSDGQWFVSNCKERYPFICEYTTEDTVDNSTSEAELVCPNSTLEWHDIPGRYCFLIEVDDLYTWNEAMSICFRKGGTLASFHSKKQLSYILPYIQHSKYPLHIGLGKTHDGSFAWVDGSAVDFVNWEHGEPSSEREYCVEMHSAVLTWNDIYCDATRGYICSIEKVPDPASSRNSSLTSTTGHLSVGGIAGIVVAILAAVVILASILFFLCYKRRYHSKCTERLYVNDCL